MEVLYYLTTSQSSQTHTLVGQDDLNDHDRMLHIYPKAKEFMISLLYHLKPFLNFY